MQELTKNRNLSIIGSIFHNTDESCNNLKIFLSRHYHSIDFLFLMLYVLLQLIFIILVYLFKNQTGKIELTVSIFIIIFLFILSSERIVLQFKSKQGQYEKDKVEIQYYELVAENRMLRVKNKELIERAKFILNYTSKNKK